MEAGETRVCTTCAVEQPLDQFDIRHKKKWRGRHRQCRACRRALHKAWVARNPDYKSKWRRENPDKMYRENRKQQLKQDYGMTIEQFDAMFAQQGGVCRICEEPSPHTLNVDHCHDTGRIRGLLCKACNRGLGMFRDNAARVQRAARYLETLGSLEETATLCPIQ